MANFNTNQARHFYVAKALQSSIGNVAAPGDIYVGVTADASGSESLGENALKHAYFVYMNGDGILTRSDSIPVKNITYVNLVDADDMDRALLAHTITVDSNILSDLANKRINLNVVMRGIVDDDPRSSIPVVASIKVGSVPAASDIYRDLALALVKALPTFGSPNYPFFRVFLGSTEVTKTMAASDLSGTYTALVIVPCAQRWRRGLMSNDPITIDVAFNTNFDLDEPWGADAVAESSITNYSVIPAAYALADEEWFCYGERGDEARGYNYPYNEEPTYMINPLDSSVEYDVITIQYYWQGNNENVQKSQKTIRIAALSSASANIYAAVLEALGLAEEDTEQGS